MIGFEVVRGLRYDNINNQNLVGRKKKQKRKIYIYSTWFILNDMIDEFLIPSVVPCTFVYYFDVLLFMPNYNKQSFSIIKSNYFDEKW